MKLARFSALCCLAVAPLLLSCSGNDTADTEAQVVITADIEEGIADFDVASLADVVIPNLVLSSEAKVDGADLTTQQDVNLTEWVVTSTRTDGGTVASPMWKNYYTVFVPAGGTADLENYRVFPAEYLRRQPLVNLFPENGGADPETGQRVVRQRHELRIYGKQISGRRVATEPIVFTIRYYYQTP